MSTLTPSAAVLTLAANSTSAVFGPSYRFPGFLSVSFSVPEPVVALSTPITPSPVALSLVAASTSVNMTINVSAIATLRPATVPVPLVTLFQLEPASFDQTLTPTPVVLEIISIAPAKAAVDRKFLPNPVTFSLPVPSVTAEFGEVTLVPDVAVLAPAVPSVDWSSSLSLSPDPVPFVVAVPEVNVATDRTVTPATAGMTFSASLSGPIAFGSIEFYPSPVTVSHAVPSPSLSFGPKVLEPTPAVLTPSVPTPVVSTAGGATAGQTNNFGYCLISTQADAEALITVSTTGTSEVS